MSEKGTGTYQYITGSWVERMEAEKGGKKTQKPKHPYHSVGMTSDKTQRFDEEQQPSPVTKRPPTVIDWKPPSDRTQRTEMEQIKPLSPKTDKTPNAKSPPHPQIQKEGSQETKQGSKEHPKPPPDDNLYESIGEILEAPQKSEPRRTEPTRKTAKKKKEKPQEVFETAAPSSEIGQLFKVPKRGKPVPTNPDAFVEIPIPIKPEVDVDLASEREKGGGGGGETTRKTARTGKTARTRRSVTNTDMSSAETMPLMDPARKRQVLDEMAKMADDEEKVTINTEKQKRGSRRRFFLVGAGAFALGLFISIGITAAVTVIAIPCKP